MGDLHLMLVRCESGQWEQGWSALEVHPWRVYLTLISKEVLDHALHGWTQPLVKALGYAPDLILHRISPDARQCAAHEGCPFYRRRDCIPNAKRLPHCFEVRGLPADLGYEVIRLWRESVYIVVVEE